MLLLGGCAGPRTLVGRGGHQRLSAVDEPSGISIIATTGAWSGIPDSLDEDVTVIHVLVANRGDKPLLLAPGDLQLKDRRGFKYELLDPGATFHVVGPEDTAPSGDPEAKLGSVEYSRENEAEYDLGGPADFLWFPAEGDVATLALPWGVLEPGTQMRGFLYFEPMAANANGGTLTWTLGTPEHSPLFAASFEFAVADLPQ